MSTTDEPTPAERAAARALAEAIDGPDAPIDADREALGAATLLAATGGFELDGARFAAVRDRIATEIGAPAPRRRWRWLFVAAPALAAAGLMLVVLPAVWMRSGEPSPAPAAATAERAAPSAAAERAAPALTAPPALIELQRRVIGGDAEAEPDYAAALSVHRRQALRALGGAR